MNKLSVLALALIMALPGCGNKKSVRSNQNIKKHMAAEDAETELMVENEDEDEAAEDLDEQDIDEDDLVSYFTEDEDGTEEADADEEDIMEEEQLDEDGMLEAWIDVQAEEDFKPVYFSFNRYGIKDDQKDVLHHNIEQIKQLLVDSGTAAQPTVVVEGHACQEGTPAWNVPLSEKRAKSVADLLVDAGIDKNIIKVVGRGQECPVVINGKVVNGDRQARWPNRRVELRVIYT